MKKQILFILSFLALGFSNSLFAQDPPPVLTDAPSCPTVNALVGCDLTDPLHPQANIEYTYSVTVPSPSGDKNYHWMVTIDKQFITDYNAGLDCNPEAVGGNYIVAAGTGYNDAGAGTASVNITWKYWAHDPDNPVFLVIWVQDDACVNDNLEVYIIEPKHSFTLDIGNLAQDGTLQADGYATCAAPMNGAIWDAATGITMDYGLNYMFFAVNAANFSHSWLPKFQTSGVDLLADRVVTAVEWNYAAAASTTTGWEPMDDTDGDNIWTSTTPVDAPSNGTVGSEGQCIVVRITIDNNNQATLVNNDVIQLAVNGIMYDPNATTGNEYTTTTLADIHHVDCTQADWDDFITQGITPRPEIQDATPPAGDNFINKDDQP